MGLWLALKDFQDIQRAETLDCRVGLVAVFLKQTWQEIDHVPDQVRLFVNVEQRH